MLNITCCLLPVLPSKRKAREDVRTLLWLLHGDVLLQMLHTCTWSIIQTRFLFSFAWDLEKQSKEQATDTLYSRVLIFQIISFNLFYETVSESIEWFIEGDGIGSYPTIFPPSLIRKLDQRQTGRLRKRYYLLTREGGGGGGGAKIYESEKARWFWNENRASINFSNYLRTV